MLQQRQETIRIRLFFLTLLLLSFNHFSILNDFIHISYLTYGSLFIFSLIEIYNSKIDFQLQVCSIYIFIISSIIRYLYLNMKKYPLNHRLIQRFQFIICLIFLLFLLCLFCQELYIYINLPRKPRFKEVKEINSKDKFVCCICLETNHIQKVIKTSCNHLYHNECINKWLLKDNSCPLCRNTLYSK